MSWSNTLEDIVKRVADIGGTLLPTTQVQKVTLIDQCHALINNTGEATNLARSKQIFEKYADLDEKEKVDFLRQIQNDFGVEKKGFNKALDNWQKSPSEENYRDLHFASEPRSQELLRRLNSAPNGTKKLVNLRQDLIQLSNNKDEFYALEKDFKHLFSSWFNRGFLELERIEWTTSAEILEKVIKYEAVHEIQGWGDLRSRVAAQDRRLYAFFHPSLDNDPLIFVEVALMTQAPVEVGPILFPEEQLSVDDMSLANTAIFYSISNCQIGLRGISFGNFLIKQVVEELRREQPQLTRFVTMSPVPGLRKWATQNAKLSIKQKQLVESLNQLETMPDATFREANDTLLMSIVIEYLLHAKHRNGGPLNSVSRFHLGNGARLERINLWADPSDKGMSNSWGVMVHYEYHLDYIEINHEAFVSQGKICISPWIKRLTKLSQEK